MKINFTFRRFEGYTPNGLGTRLIPVDRLADWLAGRQKSTSFQK